MYDIPFDRSFLQLSNGIRHVMPSNYTKPELTAKASMAQPVSQPAVYANGLNKRKYMLCLHIFILAWNSTCFGQFLCPSSRVYSLYTRQWCMSYKYCTHSFRAGPEWNCSSFLVLLESCLKTCMTYTIAECTVNELLMMDRRTVRNM
jgi:hypothetical protein